MDFGFSEEQQDVSNLASSMLSDLVTPEKLKAYDEYAAERFDRELWQQLAEGGLLGVAVQESYGGMGFGFIELCLFIEELGRTIAPVPAITHLVSAAMPIQKFGSEQQKNDYLPGVVSGTKLLTAALNENLNDNPANPTATTAVAAGDGYSVTGQKSHVAFAAQADRILVSARVDGGVAVLLVDPKADGISLTPLTVSTYEQQYVMEMENVFVAAADVLAGPDLGREVMTWLSQRTMAAICAHQLGIADHCTRLTASYTSERKQFGVPVATFQAVGHRAANCFIDVECLRLNTYQSVSRLAGELEATNEVEIAKIWAGDVGHRVSYASQHLHGGMGIDRDYQLWRYCLWARQNELVLGSSAQLLASLGKRIAAGQAYCA